MRRLTASSAAAAVAVLTCLCPLALVGQTQVRVPTEALRQSTAILRNGRVARAVVPGAVVTLRPGELITSRLPVTESPVQRVDTVQWRLPYRIEGLTESGEHFVLQPFVQVVGDGIHRQAGRDDFSSTAYVWLQDSIEPQRTEPLGQQVRLVFGGRLTVTPSIVPFNAAGAIDSVSLVSASPVGDFISLTALLQPAPDATPHEFRVPVIRPSLTVSVSPKRVQGFGMSFAQVNLTATGLPDPENVPVRVTSNEVAVNERVLLDADGMAVVKVRSGAPGPASFTATPPADLGFIIDTENAQTQFVVPVRFGLAILVGAGLGALFSTGAADKKKRLQAWIFGFVISLFIVAGGKLTLPSELPWNLADLVLDRTVGLFALSGVLAASMSWIWKLRTQ
jgi:hypothetical protein